jgi:hypothetical protein
MQPDGQNVVSLSVGVNGHRAAINAINDARFTGTWVLLTNIHLAKTFISTLETYIDEMTEDKEISETFRLWMTSACDKTVPVGILHNCTKLMLEPVSSIKTHIRESLEMVRGDLDWECPLWYENWIALRRMVFGLCYFHAVV